MTTLELDAAAGRAGRIDCACGAIAEGPEFQREVWSLSAAFGLAVFAQALMFAALPIAGGALAPRPALATLPLALTFAGAAAASIPASLLLDRFGRHAAFAIGASLGAAGGALAAWAIITRQFPVLCVGAIWLGVAQGFALFYRHAAAAARVGGSRAALIVLLGGFAGGLAAPTAIFLSQLQFGPLAEAALPALAALANILALPLIVVLPHQFAEARDRPHERSLDAAFLLSIALGAFAWFAMTYAMARTPLALIGCGVGVSVVGAAEAAHLLIMYAPMAIAASWREAIPTRLALAGGAALASLSIMLSQSAVAPIAASLLLAGLGWSFIQIGVARLLYDGADRSRIALGLNDAVILSAALLGAMSM